MVVDWKWFRYDEIFDIKKGFYNKKPENSGGGTIPFIGATESNNGITSMHTLEEIDVASKTGDGPNQDISEKIFAGNCITVSNNGSIGFAFYQEKDFTCSHDVNPLYLKGRTLNKYIAMFLCTLIELEQYRWAYGRKWRPKRMPSSLIKLPINASGTPDWDWIEQYVSETIIPTLPPKSKIVWSDKYDNKPISSTPIRLDSVKWDLFCYDEIFDIKKGKRLTKADMVNGNTNYIGATDTNNGVTAKIGNAEYIYEGNQITVSYNGSIAEAFYQSDSFWATDDVNVLSLKHHTLNVYIAMFLTTLIHLEKYRFNYGRKWDKELMLKSKIKLPIKTDRTPDWEFMENYIKSLPYSANI